MTYQLKNGFVQCKGADHNMAEFCHCIPSYCFFNEFGNWNRPPPRPRGRGAARGPAPLCPKLGCVLSPNLGFLAAPGSAGGRVLILDPKNFCPLRIVFWAKNATFFPRTLPPAICAPRPRRSEGGGDRRRGGGLARAREKVAAAARCAADRRSTILYLYCVASFYL